MQGAGEGAVRTSASMKTFKSAFSSFATKYAQEDNEARMTEQVNKLWARYDRDGSGHLEEEEAKQFFRAVWNWLDEEGVVRHTCDNR
jgi:hypothetical protein